MHEKGSIITYVSHNLTVISASIYSMKRILVLHISSPMPHHTHKQNHTVIRKESPSTAESKISGPFLLVPSLSILPICSSDSVTCYKKNIPNIRLVPNPGKLIKIQTGTKIPENQYWLCFTGNKTTKEFWYMMHLLLKLMHTKKVPFKLYHYQGRNNFLH